MITVNLTNTRSQLTGNTQEIFQIRKEIAVRAPGAFYSPAFRAHRWDGFVNYINERGFFDSGLLPLILEHCKRNEIEVQILDNRMSMPKRIKDPKPKLFTPRDYQSECTKAITGNKLYGISFPRGIVHASTNAGKTIVAALIHKSYKGLKTMVLFNNKDLFNQFIDEMPNLVGEEFGYLKSGDIKWNNFMIGMVPTIYSRMAELEEKLLEFDIVIVDECHLAASKTYKAVLNGFRNAPIRVGLSGTPLDHKDKTKRRQVESFFGSILYRISSEEIEKKGYSSKVVIKIHRGNSVTLKDKNYAKEYERGVIKNEKRNKKIWKRVRYHLSKGRDSILIVVKNHEHISQLMALCPKDLKADYLVKYVHHKIKNRKEILDEFKSGKVNILISSLIVKLGQNMPRMRAMIIGGGGSSVINSLQLIGRAKRKHESKKYTCVDDFWDQGFYLRRHSRHRLNAYKSEKHKIILLTTTK